MDSAFSHRGWLAGASVLLGLCGVFWLLGFPLYVDLPAFAFFGILAVRVPKKSLLLLLGSCAVSLVVLEVLVRTLSPPVVVEPYFRPHEKYARGSRWEPGVDTTFPMPHGDLAALDPLLPGGVAQPRTVRFKTDSLGYRNDSDYASEPVILVGDSLAAGNDNDQAEIPVNVLRREFGVAAYSVAYPTDPVSYFEMIDDFSRRTQAGFCVVLFVFEGNDFHGPGRGLASPAPYDAVKIRAITALGSRYATALFNVTRQWERILSPRSDTQTEVYPLGGGLTAFYGSYVDKALATTLDFDPGSPSAEALRRVSAVFFVPTKYRVYFPLLKDALGRRLPDPPPGYLALRGYFDQHNVPVVDLTVPMRRAARQLLANGELVYWRDDTHWNIHGVRVAAREVATFLRSGPVCPAEARPTRD